MASETNGDLHSEYSVWEAEESRRALYAAIILGRDLRAVGQVLAADALAISRPLERQAAIAQNARLREVLEFIASPPCWDAVQRTCGRG